MNSLFTRCHALCLLLLWLMTAQVLPPRPGRAAAGADHRDWLLIIEADGERQSSELAITPLLRQFAVGKVTMSRVSTPQQSLTRWQIPCTCWIPARSRCRPCHWGRSRLRPSPFRHAAKPATWRQRLPSPHRTAGPGAATGAALPGQPFVYQLSLWLPANMEAPNLTEPTSDAFTIRRLGNDQWQPPASPGLPGRLTRSWLLQAKEVGRHPLESPRFQGRLPQDDGGSDPLSARAATLFVQIDEPPLQPVASQLTLSQRLDPRRRPERVSR